MTSLDQHVDENEVAGLMMLTDDDPARLQAESHAQTCERCRMQLAAASRVMAKLNRVAAPPLGAEAHERIRAQLANQLGVATVRVPFATSPVDQTPSRWWWLASAGIVLGAFILAALGLKRVAPLSISHGFVCAGLETFGAALAVSAFAVVTRVGRVRFIFSAAAAGACASAGAFAVNLLQTRHCYENGITPHEFGFHAVPVLMAGVAAVLVTWKIRVSTPTQQGA